MNGAVIIVAAFVLGVAAPWLAMRALAPSLASSEGAGAVNFRGAQVFYGLGTVWLVWAPCVVGLWFWIAPGGSSSGLVPVFVAATVALLVFGFGLVDDAYGTSSDRGFRGHLGALARGRLTTGGLKVLGIGLVSLVAGFYLAGTSPWGAGAARLWAAPVAGAAIALTANLLNLLDLRPGRALKAYAVLGVAGWALVTFSWVDYAASGLGPSAAERIMDACALALLVAGPALAVARWDFGGVGMLGDAGANPLGAVAAVLVVIAVPLWGLFVYTAFVFALNLASERVSFSKVIESSALLRRIDDWGRPPEARSMHAGEFTAHPRPDGQ